MKQLTFFALILGPMFFVSCADEPAATTTTTTRQTTVTQPATQTTTVHTSGGY